MSKEESINVDDNTDSKSAKPWGNNKDKAVWKAQKRKWKEEKLLQKLEKKQKKLNLEEKQKQELERSTDVPTLSIALPGSILENAQSPELRTYLAGQIARAAVVFNVDEIIIFDETASTKISELSGEFEGATLKGNCNVQLARILQYLECPQYLRKSFFPRHKDLQYAGLLNPLDCPHHMRADDECPYREGVTVDKPVKAKKGSYVNVGRLLEVQVDKHLLPGVRVTVHLQKSSGKVPRGQVISPRTPRIEAGLYWGYSVRIADSLGQVFTHSPYAGGYDLTLGTSERGQTVDTFHPSNFKHALLIFGGVHGLEAALDADPSLHVEDPALLFQHYLNTCPHQGSRTIRTEEAILITLSSLRPFLEPLANNL